MMSERKKQSAFLQALMMQEESEPRRELQTRMAKAERHEWCMGLALCLVGLLVAFSILGLGYSAVLAEGFFREPSHLSRVVFGVLGLGSVICFVTFMAFWFWYRHLSNQANEECRRFLLAAMRSQPRARSTSSASPAPQEITVSRTVPGPNPKVLPLPTQPGTDTNGPLAKAS